MKFDLADLFFIIGILLINIGIYGQTQSVWQTMISVGISFILIGIIEARRIK